MLVKYYIFLLGQYYREVCDFIQGAYLNLNMIDWHLVGMKNMCLNTGQFLLLIARLKVTKCSIAIKNQSEAKGGENLMRVKQLLLMAKHSSHYAAQFAQQRLASLMKIKFIISSMFFQVNPNMLRLSFTFLDELCSSFFILGQRLHMSANHVDEYFLSLAYVHLCTIAGVCSFGDVYHKYVCHFLDVLPSESWKAELFRLDEFCSSLFKVISINMAKKIFEKFC